MCQGVLYGLGYTHLNKILSCLNIPIIDFKTFKRYEQEVGQATENIAKESCQNAADLEWQLTLENVENIQQLLPESLQSNFIIPNQSLNKSQEEEVPVTFNDVVRIIVSYDMGWSRRGTGRNYDSLNGFGAIIGSMSGLVLDYSTRNRKCKKCDSGNHPTNHDCRLNFWGIAKAMEPDVAKDIVTSSTILQSKNLEVGVLIGNCALFNTRAVEDEPEPEHSGIEKEESNKMPPIILVDLETSGFGRGCDILQIAAKCGSLTFETYVNPTQQISASATSVNGLTNNFGELCLITQYNAIYDVEILHKILKKCKISKETLINSAKGYCKQIHKWEGDKLLKIALPILDGLKGVVGENLRKKMEKASLTIENLKQVYRTSGAIGITEVLGKKINDKPVITSNKQVITKIVDWLEKKLKTIHEKKAIYQIIGIRKNLL
ncbi:hypothetical protein ALC62_03847 [Cyphomyrmex costatus]|uniref:Mutator-like transposase domain-containing protein n=1 Tax=Cyphomyrmex costatus TaxID=456900 RepID=A0A151IKV3_9HYME|nr:hypothetical protein ALC62_03847 [Cyphomyrmex costatus]